MNSGLTLVLIVVFLLGVTTQVNAKSEKDQKLRVAIVGAGIGGGCMYLTHNKIRVFLLNEL
jgi:hypothetical protein